MLIYSRALRKGDWIRLADNEGQVSEIGVLATKILTRENYIVTVPNAVVVSGKIINLSAESADGGVNLTTSVTIGYDTPWRQVHALLELAARRTPGIDQQIAPVVRKLGLLDWYTSYELQVRLLPTTKLPDGRNALHSSIIDVFNEFGVQIMSPNFVMQPKAAVVVPQEASVRRPGRRAAGAGEIKVNVAAFLPGGGCALPGQGFVRPVTHLPTCATETAGAGGLKIAETFPEGRGSPHGCGLRAVFCRDAASARPAACRDKSKVPRSGDFAGRSPGVQGGGGDWPPPVRSLRHTKHNAEDQPGAQSARN